jgi:hypothetical protein
VIKAITEYPECTMWRLHKLQSFNSSVPESDLRAKGMRFANDRMYTIVHLLPLSVHFTLQSLFSS